MSDLFPPVTPIAPIEAIQPTAGLRDTDPRIYQLFAAVRVALFRNLEASPLQERLPKLIPEQVMVSPFLPLLKEKSSALKRKKITKKNQKGSKKVEGVALSAFNF